MGFLKSHLPYHSKLVGPFEECQPLGPYFANPTRVLYARQLAACVLAFAGVWNGTLALADDRAPTCDVQISQTTLRDALGELLRQCGTRSLFPSDFAQTRVLQPVHGRFAINEILRLLLRDTNLTGRLTASGVVTIAPLSEAGGAMPAGKAKHKAAEDNGVATSTIGIQTLEEVVVSARKREESLQNVPIAVIAIPKLVLQNNLASDLSKIAELVPQVMIGRSVTGTGAVLTIRGISSAAVDSGLDQSVSLSIDGVSLSRGRIVQSTMFDMQQVEVLQGPQALFFGKNSPAGVISITSIDPGERFEGYVKGGYEFEANERFAEAAASGAITHKLKGRLAFRYNAMDGWIRNGAQPGPNPFQPLAPLPGAPHGKTQPLGYNVGGRLTLLWEPADDINVKFKLTMNRERLNSNAAYGEELCTNGQTVPLTLGVPQPNADCALNLVHAQNALPAALAANFPYANEGIPYLRSDVGLASLILNKSFGDIILTSTTGYYDQAHKGANTADYGEFVQIYGTEGERYRLINEELRLNTGFQRPINAMVGAYIEHSHRRWLNAPDILHIFNPAAQNYTTTITTSDNDSESYSVFGQVRWEIMSSLELAGGLRYTHDYRRSTFINFTGNPAAPTLGLLLYPDNTPIRARYKGNNVSPDVSLTWTPHPKQTLYAAYKAGYKAGGISNAALLRADATPQNVLYGPEKTNGFETGYKADLLRRTFRVHLTAYRYNYNGLQVTGYDAPAFRYNIQNAARARTYGVTGSFQWLATDRLSFNSNMGWNRARYLSFPIAPCYVGQTPSQGCVGGAQDLRGKQLLRAPEITFKISADYKADLMQSWVGDLSISGTYTSSYQTQTEYGLGGFQASYWLLNAAIHVGPKSESYQFSLIGRNLTNSYYKVVTFTQSFGTPNQYNTFLNRPREIVFQASHNF